MVMAQMEDLALDTCRRFLTAPQLKALCRARGFPTPTGGKEDVAVAVAARFLSPAGVGEVMRALPAPWLTVLHAVAMAGKPPSLRDLLSVLKPGAYSWDVNFRSLFSGVAKNLLTRGVALVDDSSEWEFRGGSRYEHLALVIPGEFRPLLPPFPVSTALLPASRTLVHKTTAARKALCIAIGRTADHAKKKGDIVHRTAAAVLLKDGRLRMGGRALSDPAPLLWRLRREWIGEKKGHVAAHKVAIHVLSHLPDGEGVTVADLTEAVGRLGRPSEDEDIGRFLVEGAAAGLLASGDGEAGPLYRLEREAAEEGAGELVFSLDPEGVFVDLEASGLGVFLRVAAVSVVSFREGRIHLSPDPVALAREGGAPVLAKSKAFAKAMAEIERLRGRTFLHVGLAVLRVDEPILLASITHGAADSVRPLGGPWLAVLPGAEKGVLALAKRDGFAIRRIS